MQISKGFVESPPEQLTFFNVSFSPCFGTWLTVADDKKKAFFSYTLQFSKLGLAQQNQPGNGVSIDPNNGILAKLLAQCLRGLKVYAEREKTLFCWP